MRFRHESTSTTQVVAHGYLQGKSQVLMIPKLKEEVDTLGVINDKCQQKRDELTLNTTGLTARKQFLQNAIKDNILRFAGMLQLYASDTNDQVMLKETGHTSSIIQKYSAPKLLQEGRNLLKQSETVGEKLAPYGIDPEVNNAFRKDLDEFENLIPDTRVARVNLSRLHNEYDILLKEGEKTLKRIDRYIHSMKNSDPSFCTGYWSARRIIDTGARSYTVRGKVTNANNEPVEGAFINFCPYCDNVTDEPNGSKNGLKKRSAEKGGFYIRNIAPGKYKITVTKKGFTDKTEVIEIIEGETTNLVLTLS